MQSLIRMRVSLLCCLVMIGLNVMLVMGGFVAAGSVQGEAGSPSGCADRYVP